MRALKLLCGAAALVAFLAPGAHADEWNKLTYLTFSGPVQIPGATLPAGTYTFEIANPDTTRHVIRVSEKDSGKHIGMFMTIPNDRMEPPNDNLVMFAERPAGAPQAIQVWYYPGDRIGEEFVYPKNQAVAIAKANHKRVLATDTASNASDSEESRMSAMKSASVGHVDESGNMTKDDKKAETTTAQSQPPAASTTPASPSTTTSASGSQAAPTTTSSKARTAGTTARTTTAPKSGTNARTNTANNQDNTVGTSGSARRRSLPRTASNLVAIELLSVLSLAGAFGIRRLRLATETR
jgi:hypothetical protein